MRRTVLVVAKAPVPGRVKTRLVPPLTYERAAGLHEALLLDILDACRREEPSAGLLHATADEAAALRALVGPDVPLVLQRGSGLGEALSGAIEAAAVDGPVALVSGDAPGLPPGALGRAFDALAAGADVVLGPAADGGFWLVAMAAPHPAPFHDVPWSTPAVLATVLERCRAAGLSTALTDPWADVDTGSDLAALLERRDELPARTRAWIEGLVAGDRSRGIDGRA